MARAGTPLTVDASSTYPTLGVKSHARGAFDSGVLQGASTAYKTLTQLQDGWLVYPKLMAWEGAMAVVPAELGGRWVTPEFVAYDVKGEELSRDYLRHLIAWRGFLDWVRAGSAGTNVRRRRLQPAAFEAILIPLPSRTDQDRISAHLASLESAFPENPALGVAFIRSYAYEELRRRGVAVVRLSELVSLRDPQPVVPDVLYPIGGVFGFARGILQRPALLGQETKYRVLTPAFANDVVYSKLKAFEGAVAVVSAGDGGRYFSPEFPVFEQTSSDLVPGYLEQVLLAPQVLQDLASRSTGLGARRERVHPRQFLELSVPLPDPRVQRLVVRMARQANQTEAKAKHRTRLAEAILPAARNEIFSALR